ncbi:fibronectin type III domain-containing protein [Aliikangiella coralliicola]|uniref:Fibronectin type-III domain-containing protein n=1 Tax=Aliikangiella coralliicola TaxID=2592383 RepID=A0A545U8W0_9GAMM|nr:fibronectin type III domain-containing protein [Aliikangiella coralliicola]TQV85906.1 hypothetical protein FLL46_18460 [Aliikangiella coralliicola]
MDRKIRKNCLFKAAITCQLFIVFLMTTGSFQKVNAANCAVLSQPNNLSEVANTGTAVSLQWDEVYSADQYIVQYYINGGYQQVYASDNQTTISGLPAGQFYFNVTAKNDCGNYSTASEWLAVEMSGVDECQAPSVPSGLKAINVTGNSFTATWSNVANADSYHLQRWNDASGWGNVGSSQTNTYEFEELSAGVEYVRVAANNACGMSDYSGYISVTMTGVDDCPTALSKASNLATSNVSSTSFTINWNKVENADRYSVQLWINGAWSTVGTTDELFYQLTGLAAQSTQYVRIVAKVDCDQTVYSESQWITVILSENMCPSELTEPTQLTATNITESSFRINWSAVTDADSYAIQLWINGAWSTVGTTENLFYDLRDLAQLSTQYVRIIAEVECDDSVKGTSNWITVKLESSCPAELSRPTGLNLSGATESSFLAEWNSVPEATGYQVYLATNNVWQNIGNQSSTAKTISGLSAGSYQVKVSATCGDTTSPESAVESIVIEAPTTCNLPDVNGGIDISKYGDSFDDFSVSGNLYVQGSGFNPANYEMKITCQGDYGIAANTQDHHDDNYVPFTYSYSHFGARSSNVETIQFEIRSGNSLSRKTLSWNLNISTQQNPVQPSCNDINTDNDVDGIPDCAEEYGKTFFGMPVYQWGARKGNTDIFIEVDYMSKQSSGDHGTQPRREVFDKVKSVFAERGYHLHFDVGNLFGQGVENYNLGGGQAVQYSPWIGLSDWRNEYNGNHAVPGMKNNDSYPGVFSYMPVYFENKPERSRLFYYALFAGSQAAGGEGSSGQAPDYFDYYFYVSLGSPAAAPRSRWYLNDSSQTELNRMINSQASVFMHELGHVLGLSHGGWPDAYPNSEPNFKPNYTSIMNYAYALSGVPYNGDGLTEKEMISDRHYVGVRRDKNAGCMQQLEAKYGSGVSRRNIPGGLETDWRTYHLDYSNGKHASFSESGFNEAYVLGGQDLNCDGIISNSQTSFNINYDYRAPDFVTPRFDTLRDYNDWDNIYLYYRHLNYSQDGHFLATPNLAAKYAIEPADVVPGAIGSGKSVNTTSRVNQESLIESRSFSKTSRPIGVPEQPTAPLDEKNN